MLTGLLRAIGVYKLYERWLTGQVKKMSMPRHIGVILDGNRRWATEKSLSLADGHEQGAKTGEDFLNWCLSLDIKTVTIYAFSVENFHRPKEEVEKILSLLEREALRIESDPRIHDKKMRVKVLGRLDYLPENLRKVLNRLEEATRNYDGYYLNIAVAYGGRVEIVDAAKKIAEEIRSQRLTIDQIDETLFMKYLYTAHLPNPYPDLIIRTSGEERMSGFLLWQSAYSELTFTDVWWPDFRKIDLLRSIRTYQKRVRRFGK